MRLERYVEPFVLEAAAAVPASAGPEYARPGRSASTSGVDEVTTIVGKVWPYLLAGIAIGAVIHGWVPTDFFARVAGSRTTRSPSPSPYSLGVPLYSNAAGVLPLVEALHDKGMAMGTLLAFMMSVVALSFPEMILLRRVLRPQLLGLYVAVVAGGIIAIGFLFNAVL